METIIFAMIAFVILVLVLYYLPMGFSFKGKGITALTALLMSLLGLFLMETIPVWQWIPLLCLLLFTAAYIAATRAGGVFFKDKEEEDLVLESFQNHQIRNGNEAEHPAVQRVSPSWKEASSHDGRDIIAPDDVEDNEYIELLPVKESAETFNVADMVDTSFVDGEEDVHFEMEQPETSRQKKPIVFNEVDAEEELLGRVIDLEDMPEWEEGRKESDEGVILSPLEELLGLDSDKEGTFAISQVTEKEDEAMVLEPLFDLDTEEENAVAASGLQADKEDDFKLLHLERLTDEELDMLHALRGEKAKKALSYDNEESPIDIIEVEYIPEDGKGTDSESSKFPEEAIPEMSESSEAEETVSSADEQEEEIPFMQEVSEDGEQDPASREVSETVQEIMANLNVPEEDTSVETNLQKQLYETFLLQIQHHALSAGAVEHENFIKKHLHKEMSEKTYFLFAQELLKHYMKQKEEGKFHMLAEELMEKFDGYPVLKEQIRYLINNYQKS